jgi:hypothetical protein
LGQTSGTIAAAIVIALGLLTVGLQLKTLRSQIFVQRTNPLYGCAQSFKPHVPDGSLIACSAPAKTDQYGLSRAFDAPYMFYWMDRKGFTVSTDDLETATLRRLTNRGARFLVVENRHMEGRQGAEADLRRTFSVKQECEHAVLFALSQPTESTERRGP